MDNKHKPVVYKQYIFQCPKCKEQQHLSHASLHPMPCEDEYCAVNAITAATPVTKDTVKFYRLPQDVGRGTC